MSASKFARLVDEVGRAWEAERRDRPDRPDRPDRQRRRAQARDPVRGAAVDGVDVPAVEHWSAPRIPDSGSTSTPLV